MRGLTVLEQTILAAIISLKDDAYGVSIRRKVKKHTGRTLMYGTLYRALDQMFRKGYITKTKGEPTAERDASKKIYYTLTSDGKKALQAAYRLHKSIYDIIPDFLSDSKA